MTHGQLSGQFVFRSLLKKHGLPSPESEHRFAPPRRWRFDYAFVEQRIAVEVEGGVWTRGRHTRGAGFLNDCEKYNEAALRGWLVLRITPKDLIRAETIEMVQRALKLRSAA